MAQVGLQTIASYNWYQGSIAAYNASGQLLTTYPMIPVTTNGTSYTGNISGITYGPGSTVIANIDLQGAINYGWSSRSIPGTPSLSQNGTNFINFDRTRKTSAFKAGLQNLAPAWAATTAVQVGSCLTLPGGQHLIYTVAGTTGASAPTGYLCGRPITDGSATAYSSPWFQSAIAPAVAGPSPSTTVYTTLALMQAAQPQLTNPYLFCPTTVGATFGQVQYITSNDAIIVPVTASTNNCGVAGIQAVISTSAQGQNSSASVTTANVNNPNGLPFYPGYPAGAAAGSNPYGYNTNGHDFEFYVTDTSCFIQLNAFNNTPLTLQILQDDQPIFGGPPNLAQSVITGGVFLNWGTSLLRRKITICVTAGSSYYPSAVYCTAQGKVEAGAPSNDIMLALGDSSHFAVTPAIEGQPHQIWYFKRLMGYGGIINAAAFGIGYLGNNGANTYNVLQIMQNPVNQAMWSQKNIRHVFFSCGYNERNTYTPAQICAQALQCWQLARAMWPNAKITITDGECTVNSYNDSPGSGSSSGAAYVLAAALQAQFNAWGDNNSRFIQIVGANQYQSWIWGGNNVTQALVSGNSCELISSDSNHCSPGSGVYYYANRLYQAFNIAWNGDY